MAIKIADEITKVCNILSDERCDGDDLKQTAFYKYYSKGHTIEDKSCSKAWVRSVIRNAYLDESMHQFRETPFSHLKDNVGQYGAESFDVFRTMNSIDSEEIVKRCFERMSQTLTANERQILEMGMVYGLKGKEICDVMNTTSNVVAKSKRRAIKKMKSNAKLSDCPPSLYN